MWQVQLFELYYDDKEQEAFNKVLESENRTAIVLGATSGDTGSAAIDACKNYDRIKSFIMLPTGNMS